MQADEEGREAGTDTDTNTDDETDTNMDHETCPLKGTLVVYLILNR